MGDAAIKMPLKRNSIILHANITCNARAPGTRGIIITNQPVVEMTQIYAAGGEASSRLPSGGLAEQQTIAHTF